MNTVKPWARPQVGAQWASFDKLRTDEQRHEKLARLGSGVVGELQLKGGRSVMLVDKEDFQSLIADQRELDRMRGGLQMMLRAARLVQRHPDDPETLTHLMEVVATLGLPSLPITQGHAALDLSDAPTLDDGDEPLTPAEARRLARWNPE